MKRCKALILPVLLATLAGTGAMAGLDPDPDSMGIYFDVAGNTNCVGMPVFSPVSAYLLLCNPTASTTGFACRVTRAGAPHFVVSVVLPSGIDIDSSADGFLVSGGSPYPVTGGPLHLATLQVMMQGTGALDFYVRPPVPPYGTCPGPVVFGDGGTRCCGVTSGDVNLPVASINGACPVAEESLSFGAIKGLYR